MNIETLYDYLKLLVPREYTVTLEKGYISVTGYDNLLDSAVYTIRNNHIILTTLLNIPEYAKEIFGEPISYWLTPQGMLTEYSFNIPEGLENEY